MTDRGLTAANAAALAAQPIRPALLFEGEFESGTLYLWSGVGDLVWDGHTWQGAGGLLKVSSVSEGDDIASRGITVSLTASTSIVSVALGSARQGKPGRLYLGLFDAAGSLVDSPFLLFSGRLDVPEIARGADRCTVSITYEDELVDLLRPRIRRYTYEDQRLTDPTDGFFRHITALQDVSIVWGSDLNKEIGD